LVNSKDGINFAMLFTLRESLRASFLPPGRDCQGIALGNYSFTLDALTLKPSDFCNVGVENRSIQVFKTNIHSIPYCAYYTRCGRSIIMPIPHMVLKTA
jgi:hypothetical protein